MEEFKAKKSLNTINYLSAGISIDVERLKIENKKGYYYAFNVYQNNRYIGSYGYTENNLNDAKKSLMKDIKNIMTKEEKINININK